MVEMNCEKIQPLLSEYIDNALSARDTWEIDKHLSECNPCTRVMNEMRETVQVLAIAPRFEVSEDFMANLQSRIATLEPEPPRHAWLATLREFFRPRTLPAWGAAVGACVLVVIMLVPKHSQTVISTPPAITVPSIVQTAQHQTVSLAVSNPLGDPAAAALMSDAAENGETAQ